MLAYCLMDHYEQISVKQNKNTTLFMQKNSYEHVVCKMKQVNPFVRALMCWQRN